MDNQEPKKIEITFFELDKQVTTSATMNQYLSVYEAVTALEAMSEGLKDQLVKYMRVNCITPDDDDFDELVKDITIKDLSEIN